MRKHVLVVMMLTAILALAACGGGGPVDPPDDFTRLTAQVQDTDGAPMAGLSVRVEGRATGVTTDASGNFSLGRDAFPNGVTAENDLSLGRNGLVLGNQLVVPADSPELTLRFGDNFGLTNPGDPDDPVKPTGDPGSLSGYIWDENYAEPLSGVEVTAFADWGGLLITESDVNGLYEFDELEPGEWRLLAYKEGYSPEAAVVSIGEAEDVTQHLSMVRIGNVSPGDGLIVRGTVVDVATQAPVAGALISMYADTGYLGVPEPAIYEDIATFEADAGAPAPAEDPVREGSMMYWGYEPGYYETTSAADGSFEFADEVVGYSLWMDIQAEGYMPGSHYEYIEGMTGTLDVTVELTAFVMTSISGTVVDDLGSPVEGAYVEFIYGGDFYGVPMDMAVPGVMELDTLAAESRDSWEEFDSPPPPMAPNEQGGDGDWDDWAESAAPMMGDGGGAAPSSGAGADNEFMQRFRWENQQGGHGASDAPYFTGYYYAYSDESGEFAFEDVPAGTYYVFASAYRHLPFNDSYEVSEVPAENVYELVVPNIPVGAVQGVVTDDTGAPVNDCLVNATQPYVDPFTYTDGEGGYLIDNVPAGTWIISAYKQGYLTVSEEVEITDGGTATVNLQIQTYNPPEPDTIVYGGHVVDGTDNGGLGDADLVFTPVDNEYGGWYQHVVSGANGAYSCTLIPTEYNVLVQRPDYQDLYIRIWVDSINPSMDFWLWPVSGGGGPWGGGGIEPVFMMDDAMGMPERGDGDF